MMDYTAAAFVTPITRRGFLPQHLLSLRENFRPDWTVQNLERAQPFTRVTAGSPSHQLAVGLISYLWAEAPAVLAADEELAALLATRQDRIVVRPLTPRAAHRVYVALASHIRVDVTLFHGTCVRISEIRHANRAGLDVRAVDARVEQGQVSA